MMSWIGIKCSCAHIMMMRLSAPINYRSSAFKCILFLPSVGVKVHSTSSIKRTQVIRITTCECKCEISA
ncbi:unnamed protein product [Rhodiola kirilowii]